MVMKQINLLVLASLCCLASSAPQVYYITPTQPDPQGSCHVNGMTLNPCYTLQQLNGVLSSSHGSVEVLLLPGTHLMPGKEPLNVSHFSEVVIRPWKEELEMVIECKVDYDEYLTNVWFHDIIELKILSLRFSSCKLQYDYEMNSITERSVNITKSVFEKSAVDIRSTESNLDVTVSNCTFSFSEKGTLFMLPPGYVTDTLPRFDTRRMVIGNLQITDTLFHDNSMEFGIAIFHVAYSNLIVSNCHFINNSFASDGIFLISSSLILKNTTFLHSRSTRKVSSLHLTNSSGTINASLFVSNSAYKSGGLHLRDSSGTIDACLFANNSAYKDGGVLLIENSHLSIGNSIFEGNSGTPLYISTCTFRIEEIILVKKEVPCMLVNLRM